MCAFKRRECVGVGGGGEGGGGWGEGGVLLVSFAALSYSVPSYKYEVSSEETSGFLYLQMRWRNMRD